MPDICFLDDIEGRDVQRDNLPPGPASTATALHDTQTVCGMQIELSICQ